MIGDVLAPTHLLLILIVALLVLGPKRLPEVGRSLGKGLRDFREAMTSYSPTSLLNEDDGPEATGTTAIPQVEAATATATTTVSLPHAPAAAETPMPSEPEPQDIAAVERPAG